VLFVRERAKDENSERASSHLSVCLVWSVPLSGGFCRFPSPIKEGEAAEGGRREGWWGGKQGRASSRNEGTPSAQSELRGRGLCEALFICAAKGRYCGNCGAPGTPPPPPPPSCVASSKQQPKPTTSLIIIIMMHHHQSPVHHTQSHHRALRSDKGRWCARWPRGDVSPVSCTPGLGAREAAILPHKSHKPPLLPYA